MFASASGRLLAILVLLPLINTATLPQGNKEFSPDQSTHYEGDILLATEQTNEMLKNGILPNQRWPASEDGLVRIPYTTHTAWTLDHIKMLVTAMEEIQNNTCIRFITADPRAPNFITLINDTGCYSYVGKVGGEQVLSLLDTGGYAPHCWHHKTIVHELLHAVGLWHEQSRYDRDPFIKIHYENVEPSKWHNFQKVSDKDSSVYGVPYNYESVMHYAKTAFSDNGKITIETTDPAYQDIIGNVKVGHPLDYEKIRRIYGCKGQPAKTR